MTEQTDKEPGAPLTRARKRAAGKYALALFGLVALTLTLSPYPPPDPLIQALVRMQDGDGPLWLARLVATSRGTIMFLVYGLFTVGFVLFLYVVWSSVCAPKKKVEKTRFWRKSENQFVGAMLFILLASFMWGTVKLFYEKNEAYRAEMAFQGGNTEAEELFTSGPLPAAGGEALLDKVPVEETARLLGTMFRILAALFATVVVAAVLVRFVRRIKVRKAPEAEPSPPPDMSAALARVRERLHSTDAIRDAIIACYADMCVLFAAPDGRDMASMTPREFALLLSSHAAPADDVAELTSMFEKARYSREPCFEIDRQRAGAALRSLEAFWAEHGVEARSA